MIGFLWRMIVGRFTSCRHAWNPVSEADIGVNGRVKGKMFVLRCAHCGEMTERRFMADG